MKITLESTDRMVYIGPDVTARVWHGESESGVPVLAHIITIAVPEPDGVKVYFELAGSPHAPVIELGGASLVMR